MAAENITSPVGRLVLGNLYKQNSTDADGKPLVTKNGPNAGQPRVNYFFAIAIPKGPEQHWAHTDWGQRIWKVGATAFPQACQSPAFAWKIEDGDSQTPNMQGKRPCDKEGHRGHWILKFSSGFAPKIYRLHEGAQVSYMDADAVKTGYWVQVNFNVDGNGSNTKPGVYLNHSMVSFSGFGAEIVSGPDVANAGFGQAPLPAGVLAAPIGGFNPAAVPGGLPPVPGLPGMMPPPMAVPAPTLPPPMPPAGIVPVPGAAYSIEALRAQSWTDDQIVAHGYASRPAPAAAAPMPPAMGVAPLPPGFSAPAPAAPAAPIAPVGVAPNPGFVQLPPGAGMPMAPAGLVMNPGAPGTQAQFHANGWTDDQIVAHGHARRA